nr:MAG TPA: hypothetical protein [Caudoviricetes sp.]
MLSYSCSYYCYFEVSNCLFYNHFANISEVFW